jgi:hypothetical protein
MIFVASIMSQRAENDGRRCGIRILARPADEASKAKMFEDDCTSERPRAKMRRA